MTTPTALSTRLFLSFLSLLSSSIYLLVSVLLIIALLLRFLYNIFFHPLRSYPGPYICAASRLPLTFAACTGQLPFWTASLHAHYGPIVRIAPHQLSYTSAAAWRDIYGNRQNQDHHQLPDHHHHHRDHHAEMPKEYTFRSPNGAHSINSAPDRGDHVRMRRLVAHAFSEKALREQKGFLLRYVDRLVGRLNEKVAEGNGNGDCWLDMVKWVNYTTFDLIGDLTFGESFKCLDHAVYHPFVSQIFSTIKPVPFAQSLQYYHLLPLARFLSGGRIRRLQEQRAAVAYEKLARRVKFQFGDRKDFMSYILRYEHDEQRGMTTDELGATADFLVFAGSETTATVLSGAFYHLLKNEKVYKKLVEEVRGAFRTDGDIIMRAVGELQYLSAVVEESLRMYPSVPNPTNRIVPGNGAVIAERFVPPKTTVGVAHWAAYHSSSNFHNPDSFAPERFLHSSDPSSPFHSDKRAVLQPFSYGARNCIGRNLAYAEMRLILAKVLWHFDLELAPESDCWVERQKVFAIWEKIPLMVKLTPVAR